MGSNCSFSIQFIIKLFDVEFIRVTWPKMITLVYFSSLHSFWFNTQSVKVLWSYNNRRTFHNIQLHLVYWHDKMCRLIGHIICDSLVKIQYFRHECSSIIYEKIPKKNRIKGCSITCSHIWHIDVSECVYWLEAHSEKVWWRYGLPKANDVHFCSIF